MPPRRMLKNTPTGRKDAKGRLIFRGPQGGEFVRGSRGQKLSPSMGTRRARSRSPRRARSRSPRRRSMSPFGRR